MCELLGEELQEGRLVQGQRQTEVFCTMEAVSMPRFSLGSQHGGLLSRKMSSAVGKR